MHVNSIRNFSFNSFNTIEKPNPETPSFGALKFKNKALRDAVQFIDNAIEISLESDNIPYAEAKVKKYMKMFMEPWDLRLYRPSKLPKSCGSLPKMLGESTHPASPIRVFTKDAAAYNERIAKLGDEAADLNVEVVKRTVAKNGDVTYLLDVPSMGVKHEKFVVKAMFTDNLNAKYVPSEKEVEMLKNFVYEEVVGKGLTKEVAYTDLMEAFTKMNEAKAKPAFDIHGNWKKLTEFMQGK